ncbi:hypothetical protein CLU83_3220 [Flavobacterium sp. 1]|nr:hypothetical protein CLU83_3220 [Flavobacterium sp. 1]
MAFFLIFFRSGNFFKINGTICLVFFAFTTNKITQSGTMTTRFFKEIGLNYNIAVGLSIKYHF